MNTPYSSWSSFPLAWTFGLALMGASAQAQQPVPALEGIVNLSASAVVEVPRDWMSMSLSATRDGPDAVSVQSQLKQALDTALAEGRKLAKPGQVELRAGGFSVYPRYSQKGLLSGWQGSTELVVEGRDMAGIGQLSGRIGSMTIGRVSYTLSREAREKVEAEVTAQAVARFRAQAAEQARLFGYAGFVLREVSVSTNADGGSPEPRQRIYTMAAKVADGEALPVEAGKGQVSATVNGSIQLKP
jgi:predicted secreted protein